MTRHALAVLVVLAAAGIATIIVLIFGGSDAPEPPGTDVGHAMNPIGTEPADIAVTAMAGVFTWQPAVQDSPWDALHSQQQYLTGPMSIAAAQPPQQAPAPHPDWAAWARSNDTVTAVVRAADESEIINATATLLVTIAQNVQHTDGSATPYGSFGAEVTLNRVDGGWKVSNYRLGKT